MIPSIRIHIDLANIAAQNGDGDNDGQRISIPPSELAELKELRKTEYTERAREEHNARIAEMVEAEARATANNVAPVDMERSYGLPQGEACQDIWELVFEYVNDVEDIANLRDTCVLFRRLLEAKYKILKFNQVASKLANKFGGFNSLLNLRQVCKSSKVAVDQLLAEDKLYTDSDWEPFSFDPYLDEHWIKKPEFLFRPDETMLERLVESLQSTTLSPDYFPVKIINMIELTRAGENQFRQDPAALVDLVDNPFLPEFRSHFQSFLGLAGNSIRSFELATVMNCLDTYNQLRSWVTMMPHLEEMAIAAVIGEPMNDESENIPNFDLLPFPSCPRLKRYANSTIGFSAPFITEIFQANPQISDVFLCYWSRRGVREVGMDTILSTLDTMRLEKLKLLNLNSIPPPQFLEYRPQWPLKSLSLLCVGAGGQQNVEIQSRALFAFINSLRATLEEVEMNWKIRDTGGYLDVPEVFKLCWKMWPNFLTLDFIVALGKLKYLDVDLAACDDLNNSIDNVKEFIDENSLPSVFPLLRRIRARVEARGDWLQIWNS